MTAEETFQKQEKSQCQSQRNAIWTPVVKEKVKPKEERISKTGLLTESNALDILKRMKAKKRPLNVATKRPLVTRESGRRVVKEDRCPMLRSKQVREGKTREWLT